MSNGLNERCSLPLERNHEYCKNNKKRKWNSVGLFYPTRHNHLNQHELIITFLDNCGVCTKTFTSKPVKYYSDVTQKMSDQQLISNNGEYIMDKM